MEQDLSKCHRVDCRAQLAVDIARHKKIIKEDGELLKGLKNE